MAGKLSELSAASTLTGAELIEVTQAGASKRTTAGAVAALAAGQVSSVAGRTGAVTLAAADLTDGTAVGRSLVTAADPAAVRHLVGAVSGSTAVPPSAVRSLKAWIDATWRVPVSSDNDTITALTNRADGVALAISGSPKFRSAGGGSGVGRPGIQFPTDGDWIDFAPVDANTTTTPAVWDGNPEQDNVSGLSVFGVTSGRDAGQWEQWLTGWNAGSKTTAVGMSPSDKTLLYFNGTGVNGLLAWPAQADGDKVLWVVRLPRTASNQWAFCFAGSGYGFERLNACAGAPRVSRVGGNGEGSGARPEFRLHEVCVYDRWLKDSETAAVCGGLLAKHRDVPVPRAVCLGDSITAQADESEGWPYQMQAAVTGTYPRLTVNRMGVSGRGVGEWLVRWDDEVRPAVSAPGTVAVVWCLTNAIALQGYTGVQAARMQLQLAHLIRSVGAEPVLGTCLPRSSFLAAGVTQSSFQAQADAGNAWLRAEAAKYGYTVADFAAAGWAATYLASLSADGTHPNASGITAIAGTAATAVAAAAARALAD